jgi:preprotein translocase subunit SecG
MVTLITIIHVFACFFLILVVLLQAGKGGGMGIAFGSSTSAQVFGGRGAGSFLEKLTAGTAIVFMLTSLSLAWFASQSDSSRLQKLAAQKQSQKQTDDKKAADAKVQKEAAQRAKELSSTPPSSSTSAPGTTPAPTTTPVPPPPSPPTPSKKAPIDTSKSPESAPSK